MSFRSLTNYEEKFIEIWGLLYERRSQSKLLGEIWGLLTLKADLPEYGLDQQEISKLLNKSLSTVSRQMKTLVNMQIASFTENGTRKYYTSKNFKQVSNLRFQATIQEYLWTIKQMESIKADIPKEKIDENGDLIKNLDLTNNVLQKISKIYQRIIET